MAEGKQGTGMRRYAKVLKSYLSALDLALKLRTKQCYRSGSGFGKIGGGFGVF